MVVSAYFYFEISVNIIIKYLLDDYFLIYFYVKMYKSTIYAKIEKFNL